MISDLELEIDVLQGTYKWAIDYKENNYTNLSKHAKETIDRIIRTTKINLKHKQKQYKNEQTIIS